MRGVAWRVARWRRVARRLGGGGRLLLLAAASRRLTSVVLLRRLVLVALVEAEVGVERRIPVRVVGVRERKLGHVVLVVAAVVLLRQAVASGLVVGVVARPRGRRGAGPPGGGTRKIPKNKLEKKPEILKLC